MELMMFYKKFSSIIAIATLSISFSIYSMQQGQYNTDLESAIWWLSPNKVKKALEEIAAARRTKTPLSNKEYTHYQSCIHSPHMTPELVYATYLGTPFFAGLAVGLLGIGIKDIGDQLKTLKKGNSKKEKLYYYGMHSLYYFCITAGLASGGASIGLLAKYLYAYYYESAGNEITNLLAKFKVPGDVFRSN